MKLITLLSITACLLATNAAYAASTADSHYVAGMAVAGATDQVLDGGRHQVNYKLVGAARLTVAQKEAYGFQSCTGAMIKASDGHVEKDTAECVWTEANGDRIHWHYEAQEPNTGPGYQHAKFTVVSGTGRWQKLAGHLESDVMFKPHPPEAPGIFTTAAGKLSLSE